jgi:hypothetical protein
MWFGSHGKSCFRTKCTLVCCFMDVEDTKHQNWRFDSDLVVWLTHRFRIDMTIWTCLRACIFGAFLKHPSNAASWRHDATGFTVGFCDIPLIFLGVENPLWSWNNFGVWNNVQLFWSSGGQIPTNSCPILCQVGLCVQCRSEVGNCLENKPATMKFWGTMYTHIPRPNPTQLKIPNGFVWKCTTNPLVQLLSFRMLVGIITC